LIKGHWTALALLSPRLHFSSPPPPRLQPSSFIHIPPTPYFSPTAREPLLDKKGSCGAHKPIRQNSFWPGFSSLPFLPEVFLPLFSSFPPWQISRGVLDRRRTILSPPSWTVAGPPIFPLSVFFFFFFRGNNRGPKRGVFSSTFPPSTHFPVFFNFPLPFFFFFRLFLPPFSHRFYFPMALRKPSF